MVSLQLLELPLRNKVTLLDLVSLLLVNRVDLFKRLLDLPAVLTQLLFSLVVLDGVNLVFKVFD